MKRSDVAAPLHQPRLCISASSCYSLEEYDNGARPICNKKCCHHCQTNFFYRYDESKQEMHIWWGKGVSTSKRAVMVGEESMKFCCYNSDGGKRDQLLRILGTEVCRNFYLWARGLHHSTVSKIEVDIFCADWSLLSLSSGKKEATGARMVNVGGICKRCWQKHAPWR